MVGIYFQFIHAMSGRLFGFPVSLKFKERVITKQNSMKQKTELQLLVGIKFRNRREERYLIRDS